MLYLMHLSIDHIIFRYFIFGFIKNFSSKLNLHNIKHQISEKLQKLLNSLQTQTFSSICHKILPLALDKLRGIQNFTMIHQKQKNPMPLQIKSKIFMTKVKSTKKHNAGKINSFHGAISFFVSIFAF